jgi:hypothetical protein
VCQSADSLPDVVGSSSVRGRYLWGADGIDAVTFDVVFGLFAAAMVVLVVLIIRSAVLRQRDAARDWSASREQADEPEKQQ